MRGRLRRWCRNVLTRMSDHPFKTAGAIAVVVGLAVMVVGTMSATGGSTTTTSGASVTLSTAIAFAKSRPAYPAAVLVGLAVLFYRPD